MTANYMLCCFQKEVDSMNNKEIRTTAKNHGVKMWQIAEALGIQDSALSRRMRHELPDDERKQIIEIIENIAQQRKAVIA